MNVKTLYQKDERNRIWKKYGKILKVMKDCIKLAV